MIRTYWMDWEDLLDYSEEASKRTIKFSLLNRDWTPAYRRYQYELYGAIQSYRFDRLDDDPLLTCFIEFEDPQVVDDLLASGYICINDHKIKIEPMLQCESKDSSKKTSQNSMLELSDDSLSENILTVLNDDCLREIFRKLHMSTLHTVSNVCVRFNGIAKEIFKLKYQSETIEFCDVVMDYPISLQDARNFLKNFGSSIEKLTIAAEAVAFDETLLNDLLRIISKFCINICDLKMDYKLHVSNEILMELRQLFCRLKHVKLNVKNTDPPNALFLSCSQLECIPIEMGVFPNLLELDLFLNRHASEYFQLLKCHLQLKSISITAASTHKVQTTIFKDIAEKFPNIDTLFISITEWQDDNFATNILHLGQLKRLQRLTLNFCEMNVTALTTKMVENNVDLKYLELRDHRTNDDTIDIISQMKSIEELDLGNENIWNSSPLNTNQLKRLAKLLPNLNKLTISKPLRSDSDKILDIIAQVIPFAKQLSMFRIDVIASCLGMPDFNENICSKFTKVIQEREKPKKLTIIIDCIFCDRSDTIQKKYIKVINNEWLRVDIELSLERYM